MATGFDSPTLSLARFYAERGWRVIPIKPGLKRPEGNAWQDRATTDTATIKRWWAVECPQHGIGVATGPESGIFIVDIDHEEGRRVLARWEAEYGSLPDTVEQISGSGDGRHLVFRHPGRRVRTRRGTSTSDIPVGIDIRGDGGQFVVAPTVHESGNLYAWRAGHEPWGPLCVAEAPAWLLDIVCERGSEPAPVVEPQRRGIPLNRVGPPSLNGHSPNGHDDETPSAYIARTYPLATQLGESGWTPMQTYGNEQKWCRPGKDPRLGHSAVLHLDDPQVLVVFSTDVDARLMQRQYETGRGDGWRFDAFEFLAAMHHGGDKVEAGRVVRRSMPVTQRHPSSFIAPQRPLNGSTAGGGGAEGELSRSILDNEFWTARPLLTVVRSAAWSRYAAPGALLTAVLARAAAIVPPSVVIPGDYGEVSPLSMFVAVYGPSGTGKSLVGRLAGNMLHMPPWCVGPLALGSGEGLVEAYMELVEEETEGPDGKKRKVKVKRQVKRGALFSLDEGQMLAETSGRKGSTIMSVLRTAWSGHDPGQANASTETKRHLAPGSYAVGLISGWQDDAAMTLLDDHVGGTPQRFLWSAAQDSTIPRRSVGTDARIEPLAWHPPALCAHDGIVIPSPIALAPAAEVATEALRYGVATGTAAVAALDSHRNLMQLRVAGLLAVLDGRERQMVDEDWQLAASILAASDSVRNWILHLAAERKERVTHERLAARVGAEFAVEDAATQRALDSGARAVARVVLDGRESATRREAHFALNSRTRKLISVDEAVAEAERKGWVAVRPDGSLAPGESRPA
jgi:hypothetical protein